MIVRYVQEIFIGEHIKYDVHRCTEVIPENNIVISCLDFSIYRTGILMHIHV